MNIDENTTPDRFEALPVLLDHLNDEFLMVLTHFDELVVTIEKSKIKNLFKSIRSTQKNTRNLSRGVPASQNHYLT